MVNKDITNKDLSIKDFAVYANFGAEKENILLEDIIKDWNDLSLDKKY